MIYCGNKKTKKAYLYKNGKFNKLSIYYKKSFKEKLITILEDESYQSIYSDINQVILNHWFLPTNISDSNTQSNYYKQDTYNLIVNNKKPSDYIEPSDWFNDINLINKQVANGYKQKYKKHIGVYYSEWSIYNRGFYLRDLPINSITHLYYAFLGMKPQINKNCDVGAIRAYLSESSKIPHFSPMFIDEYASLHSIIDSKDLYTRKLAGNIGELYRIKKVNPELKIILSIGGWTLSDGFFHLIYNRNIAKRFAENLKRFLMDFDVFDGIDFDMEFQCHSGLNPFFGTKKDGDLYYEFLVEVRKKLNELEIINNKHYELISTIGINKDTLPFLPIDKITRLCDSTNLMTYDMYGAWNNIVYHQSPLYNNEIDEYYSIDYIVRFIERKGAILSRVNIGSPAYARGWQNFESDSTTDNPFDGNTNSGSSILEPVNLSKYTPYNLEKGAIDLTGIEELYGPNGTLIPNGIRFDDRTKSNFVWDKKRKIFLTFDYKEAIEAKVDYVIDKGLQGIFYWEASTDKYLIELHTINQKLRYKKIDTDYYLRYKE